MFNFVIGKVQGIWELDCTTTCQITFKSSRRINLLIGSEDSLLRHAFYSVDKYMS